MQTIKEYINENELYNILKNHLIYHINIEQQIENPFSIFNESLGTFNNCGKIAQEVFDKLYENYTKVLCINVKKYKVYFDELKINCNKSTTLYGTYIGQENRIVTIEMYIPEKLTYEDFDEFIFLLIHELMHGYEDKRRIKHDKPSIFNLLDDTYNKSFKLLTANNEITRNISKLKYFLNDQEVNAYFGTLDEIIKRLIEKNNITKDNIKYDKLIDDIKQQYIFKEYFNLCKFIIQINNDNIDNKDKNKILDIYNNYYKENITYNKFVKNINTKWNKFYSKFNQLVPKIICKYIVNTPKTLDIIKI